MAALSLPAPAPARISLVDHLEETDAILDTLEGIDDEAASDAAREELARRLVESIAGTKSKVDSTARVIAQLEAAEAAAKTECERLAARAKHFARQSDRLKGYVLGVLAANGLAKLEGFTATLAARANPVRVVVDDERAIPYEYLRSPAVPADQPDKKLIGDAWKRGIEVAGTHIEQTNRLVRS